MKILAQLLTAAAFVALTACGGGGGGGNSNVSGTVFYDHEELAEIFVDRLWTDAGIDAELVKVNTHQFDYIVVYDHDLDTYDAYWLGNYNVGENILTYLDIYDHEFYYDLDYIGSGDYQDYWSGLIFEKTFNSSKDLLKVAAMTENDLKRIGTERIAAEYGLTLERAEVFFDISLKLKNTPKGRYTATDFDGMAEEMLGYSLTTVMNAAQQYVEGDSSTLKSIIVGAAKHNDEMDPEAATRLVEDLFQIPTLK